MTPLILEKGLNTVVITALDQHIGAWLFFTLLCNYLDRGYKLTGFTSSLDSMDEKEIIAKWDPFVISDQQVLKTFGFQPAPARFQAALESMHYHVQYDQKAQAWQITPPSFASTSFTPSIF